MTSEEIMYLGNEAIKIKPYPNTLFPPSLYYRFFQMLAAKMRPLLSVVLGVCGGGCLHFALGWPRGMVVGVDVGNHYPDRIKHINDCFSNFRFIQGDSLLEAENIFNTYGPINILFLDTVHTYEQTMREFNTYKEYLHDGAVLCLDDLFQPGVENAWNEIPGEKIRMDFLHPGSKVSDTEGNGGFGVVLINQ